jgi:hypothetical protein
MSVDNALWSETFPEKGLPQWTCPTCGKGKVVASDKSPTLIEPKYSKKGRQHNDWEPDWITERFVALLKCSNPDCGETILVTGDTLVVEVEDEEFGRSFQSQLRPHSVFPAPAIIDIPRETPREIANEIWKAFGLFWSDLGASASRLRTSVERMMDDFKIPKTLSTPQKKSKRFRTLASRIILFKAKMPTFGDHMDALRYVGNLGTHAEADRQSLLAGFAIYEDALAEIYGKRSKKAKTLTKKLIKGKGILKAS